MCNWTETVLKSFPPCIDAGGDGCAPGNGDLIFDRVGNIYGTTQVGGTLCLSDYPYGCGVVYELTPSSGGWTESILHRFTGGSDGYWPMAGVTLDQAGNLSGTTTAGGGQFGGVVYQLSPSGSGWSEGILHSFSGGDGTNLIGGVILDPSENLYGATTQFGPGDGGTVYKLSPSWGLTILYSFGQFTGGSSASLLMDAAGNLYGTTSGQYGGGGSVFKLTRSGLGYTYTSLHDFTKGSDGGNPQGVVIMDSSGNLYGTASQGGSHNCVPIGCGVVWEITP